MCFAVLLLDRLTRPEAMPPFSSNEAMIKSKRQLSWHEYVFSMPNR